MGKKKRRNGNNHKKPETPPEPSRRDVLKWGGGLALLLGGSGALYFGLRNSTQDQWAFLNRPSGITQAELDKIKFTAVPVGPSSRINNNTARFDPIKERIIKRLGGQGFTKSYYLKTYEQLYGQSDLPEFIEPLLAYCKKAHDFLYQNIHGLRRFNLDWTILRHGDNYQKNFEGKVFLGNGFCEVLDHFVHDEKTDEMVLPHSTAKATMFANRTQIEYKNKDSNEMIWFYICIQTGQSALKAPFSEIFPLSLVEKQREYGRIVGSEQASLSVEAMSEAAGYLLSLELAQELNIPDGFEIINQNHQLGVKHNPKYRQVPQAVKWMKKNTIQAASDLYMEDPEKFMRAIKS